MKKAQPPRKAWDPQRNLLETELGNGWMVMEKFEMQDGRRVVAQLTICPAPLPAVAGTVRKGRRKGDRPEDAPVPAGGITARLLRTVKVGKAAEPVIADYRHAIRKWFGADALKRLDAHTGQPSRRRRRREPRSRRATDRSYAELARDYAWLWQHGERAPTAALAAMRGVPIEKMRSHIHLARANGFLTETSRGRAGGEVTAKAWGVLKGADATVPKLSLSRRKTS
jgi:hypothetical protein